MEDWVTNQHLTGAPEERMEKKAILKKIMVKNNSDMIEKHLSSDSGNSMKLKQKNGKKPTSRQITVKMQNNKDRRSVLTVGQTR